MQSAAGVFHDREAELRTTRQLAHRSGPRLIEMPAHIDIVSVVSICTRAYAEACEIRRRQALESTPRVPRVA